MNNKQYKKEDKDKKLPRITALYEIYDLLKYYCTKSKNICFWNRKQYLTQILINQLWLFNTF